MGNCLSSCSSGVETDTSAPPAESNAAVINGTVSETEAVTLNSDTNVNRDDPSIKDARSSMATDASKTPLGISVFCLRNTLLEDVKDAGFDEKSTIYEIEDLREKTK